MVTLMEMEKRNVTKNLILESPNPPQYTTYQNTEKSVISLM